MHFAVWSVDNNRLSKTRRKRSALWHPRERPYWQPPKAAPPKGRPSQPSRFRSITTTILNLIRAHLFNATTSIIIYYGGGVQLSLYVR